MLRLVFDGGPVRGMLQRLPARGQLHANPRACRLLLRGGQHPESLDEPLGNALLLLEDRAPCRLRRVRREHRLDGHLAQERERLVEASPLPRERRDARHQATGLRVTARHLVVASSSNPVDLFAEVDDLEVRPERADDVGRRRHVEPFDRLAHRELCAILTEPAGDRRGAHLLDAREQCGPALLLEDIAHQGTGDADIAAERLVLARKINGSHDWPWSEGCRERREDPRRRLALAAVL